MTCVTMFGPIDPIDPFDELLRLVKPPQRQGYLTPQQVAKIIDPRTVETPALTFITTRLHETRSKRRGRLMISMPPQEGKTSRCSRDWVISELTRDPNTRVTIVSYGADKASDIGRSIRDAILFHGDQLGLHVSPAAKAMDNLQLVEGSGGVRSVGLGGGLTGFATDIMILDDVSRDLDAASSPAARRRVWAIWTGTILTRLAPTTPVVVVGTRFHEDDLHGRILRSPGAAEWEVVSIPAQAEEGDVLGRPPGAWLWSARGRTSADWLATKASVGARAWEAIYQGNPTPPAGDVIARTGWRYWTRQPDLTGAVLIQSWDLAFKATARSDFVVGQVWAKVHERFWLLDQERGRWGFTDTLAAMKRLSDRWPHAVVRLIEDKANGSATLDALKAQSVTGLVAVQPRGSKEERVEACTPLIDAGLVILPSPAIHEWADDFVEEASAFPNGTHDDQIDAMTQALARLAFPNSTRSSTGFQNVG